jgi:hypothetical protein
MLDFHFDLTQRGEIPVDAVGQALVDVHRRGTALLLTELTRAVSGGIVQTRTGRLRAGLMARIVASKTGEVTSQVGFDKRVAFIARFLERGTKPHLVGRGARLARAAFGKRRAQRARAPFTGKRGGVLAFVVGGQRIFRRSARHPGLRPRPILQTALDRATPVIQQDFEQSMAKATGNG